MQRISDATGTFTITNDESAPTVTSSTSNATTIAEDGGGSITLTATSSSGQLMS